MVPFLLIGFNVEPNVHINLAFHGADNILLESTKYLYRMQKQGILPFTDVILSWK